MCTNAFTNLVFEPTVLFQHLLAFDCALEAVELELDLGHRVHQPLEHVLGQAKVLGIRYLAQPNKS